MHHADNQALLRAEMQSRFGLAPECVRFVQVPYRICPLGAHIDHQLGRVTALAIDRGVLLAFAPSGSAELRLRSLAFPGEVKFRVDNVPLTQPGDWGNYARGAVFALKRHQAFGEGFLGITAGDLAEGGLSSSASIGVAYLLALQAVNGLRVAAAENIRLDQAIENEYLGLNNGILDQAAVLCSRRDCLTVIDCRAFARETRAPEGAISIVPKCPASPPFAIVIAFSGLARAVMSTDYNRRVAECTEAARLLLEAAGRPHAPTRLGEVTREEFEAWRSRLPGPLGKRAEHFFSETERVTRGLEAWNQGDLAAFGRLMRESGESSIAQYECGSPPLIDLHEVLNHTPGIYGARFSGAGFRGCCFALAEPEAARRALPEMQREYAARQPALADRTRFFLCPSSDGARLL